MNTNTIRKDALAYHTKWEKFLHEREEIEEKNGKSIDPATRSRLVDEFVRHNPSDCDKVVHCDVCERRFSDNLLQHGTTLPPRRDLRELMQAIAQDLGKLRNRRQRIREQCDRLLGERRNMQALSD